jgi:hypothetical protein
MMPWAVDAGAMNDFLETRLSCSSASEAEQETLDRASQWPKAKLSELGIVNVVVSNDTNSLSVATGRSRKQGALIAAVVSSAFTWPAAADAPWTVLATFYGALILSLSAVSTGSQQSIALYRLGTSKKRLRQLQRLLETTRKTNAHKGRRLQQYLWQVPIMLLNVSILVFLIGLLILIWHRAAQSPSWDRDMKARSKQMHISMVHYDLTK